MTDVATGDGWELRCGRWEDVLADVESVDAVVTDPPYGARTHEGQRHGRRGDQDSEGRWVSNRALGYDAWNEGDVWLFVDQWSSRVSHWICALTSHDLIPHWQTAFGAVGRYVFAPLSVQMPGMNVRLAGDGPSSWTVWLIVSRPRGMKGWGTLPGGYHGNPFDPGDNTVKRHSQDHAFAGGAKPLWLMRALIRDYSRPGDLVCDPCAGGGTTLLAAVIEGRRAIGAERDPDTFSVATQRLRAGHTPAFDFGGAS